MKNFYKTFVVLSISTIAHSQQFGDLNLDILISQLPNSEKSIEIIYHKQKMHYVNTINKQMLFAKGFDIAYPFFQKAALIQNNRKYGVIDRKGDFLIPPIHPKVSLAPFDHESHIIIFDDGLIFDLQTGATTNSYLHDEEPKEPEWNIFMDKNNKYGIKEKLHTIISANYDSILEIGKEVIIASKKGKLGVIDFDEKILIDFIYEDVAYSLSTFNRISNIIGLKKNKKWFYFLRGEPILESKFECDSFTSQLSNSIGVFSRKAKQNILFKDGTTLKRYYDFISENGLLAIKGNKVYLLRDDRFAQLYYRKND